MATIRERKGQKGVSYEARVRHRGHPTITRSFRRKTDAKRWAAEQETRLLKGQAVETTEARRRTLADAIDRYLALLDTKDAKDRRRQLEWWKARLGGHRISAITPALIGEGRDALLTGGKNGDRPASPATAVRYLAALSHLFTLAEREWRWANENPVRLVKKPKEPRGRVRFLADEERERLLAACRESRSPRLYPLVVVAMVTGARQGELLNLRWQDVDLERGQAVLHDTKNGERRAVPLVGPAVEALREHGKVRRIDTDLVFASENGKKTRPQRVFREALEEAQIERFRFHDLRHTAASYLAMSGATLGEIAEILGHKTLQMVKRYAHLTELHTKKVAERMSAQFFG